MKKLTKNILNTINLDIPALTEDNEGKLHGGFTSPDDPLGLPYLGVNKICGNDGCLNVPCTNSSCINIICATTTTTTTKSPNSIGNPGVLI